MIDSVCSGTFKTPNVKDELTGPHVHYVASAGMHQGRCSQLIVTPLYYFRDTWTDEIFSLRQRSKTSGCGMDLSSSRQVPGSDYFGYGNGTFEFQ